MTSVEWEIIPVNGQHLDLFVTWKPARDMTCYYEVIMHDERGFHRNIDKNGTILLYQQIYTELEYNNTYNLAVRGRNYLNLTNSIPGGITYKIINVPDCWKLLGAQNICGPEEVESLNFTSESQGEDLFILSVSWDQPEHLPEKYLLWLFDQTFGGNYKQYLFEINGVRKNIFQKF